MRHSPGRAFLAIAFRPFVTAAALAVLSPGAPAQPMRCESPDGSYRERRIGSNGRVRLDRQTGEAACVLNRTWGYDADGIGLSDGCRAGFAVARRY